MNISCKKNLLSGMRYREKILLGSVIRLNRELGEAKEGEYGVCYEVFQKMINDKLVEGYSFIFEQGFCTSLLPDEIEDNKVYFTGRVSKSHQHRWFTYFSDVMQHWREGGFDDAFKPVTKLSVIK